MKKLLLVILTIISVLISVFGYFHIPILSYFGVELFPNRSFLWLLFLFPTVVVCQLPLVFCIKEWVTKNKAIKK